MKFIELTRTLSGGSLYLTGFKTDSELKAAKERAKAKGLVVVYSGQLTKVKEWQAAHWVQGQRHYKDYGDGLGPLVSGPGKSKAVDSLKTAVEQIGNPPLILIWKG